MPHIKRTAKEPPITAHPALWYAMGVVEVLFNGNIARKPVFTSFNDGKHRKGSLHYQDRAFDFGMNKGRTNNASESMRLQLITELRAWLEPLGFDVVYESPGTQNCHGHVEYDPELGDKFWTVVD